jgi:Zn-finger protein
LILTDHAISCDQCHLITNKKAMAGVIDNINSGGKEVSVEVN